MKDKDIFYKMSFVQFVRSHRNLYLKKINLKTKSGSNLENRKILLAICDWLQSYLCVWKEKKNLVLWCDCMNTIALNLLIKPIMHRMKRQLRNEMKIITIIIKSMSKNIDDEDMNKYIILDVCSDKATYHMNGEIQPPSRLFFFFDSHLTFHFQLNAFFLWIGRLHGDRCFPRGTSFSANTFILTKSQMMRVDIISIWLPFNRN